MSAKCKTALALLLLVLTPMLAGCSGPGARMVASVLPASMQRSINNQNGCYTSSESAPKFFSYFAAPVCDQYALGSNTTPVDAATVDSPASGQSSPNRTLQVAFVAAAVDDSRNKCAKFINDFTAGQSAENTFADVTGLILSGLSAVFTPINTIRGLAAASTAVQGTKQAVNSDLFQSMTMALFIQQINSSYYTKLDDFVTGPTAQSPAFSSTSPGFSAAAELVKIKAIHDYCSVPFAVNQLAANSQNAASGPASSTPAPADPATLPTGQSEYDSPSVGTPPVTMKYLVTVTQTAASPPVRNYTLSTQIGAGKASPPIPLGADTILLMLKAARATLKTAPS